MIDSRCGRILDSGERSMISERGVRLDQRAGRRRVRPPADRDVDAVAAAPGPARPRGLERGAGRRRRAGKRIAGGPRSCAGPPTWSTGRRSAAPSTRWPADRARSGEPAAAARPPATICVLSGDVHHAYVAQATSTEQCRLAGLPADLLAVSQLRADRDEAWSSGWPGAGPPSGATRVCSAPVHPVRRTATVLASHRRTVLRQRADDLRGRRPAGPVQLAKTPATIRPGRLASGRSDRAVRRLSRPAAVQRQPGPRCQLGSRNRRTAGRSARPADDGGSPVRQLAPARLEGPPCSVTQQSRSQR